MASGQGYHNESNLDESQSSIPDAIPLEHNLTRAENPVAHFPDQRLQEDVDKFLSSTRLNVQREALLRAARVAKDIDQYEAFVTGRSPYPRGSLLVQLTDQEITALRRERLVPFSERGMWVVIVTVSLAAILQGFVQSSFNGANLYSDQWAPKSTEKQTFEKSWGFSAANASPWFFAALVGCPSALPINYCSVAAIFAKSWQQLFAIRAINGIGMGIKAVSATILASECAVGFWRGSTILAWQLWVAFGIMTGFAFNLIFMNAKERSFTFRLIQGAPLVPALVLFATATFLCPESPRYHLTKGPGYSIEKAYEVLKRLRNTEALRDLYVVTKDLERDGLITIAYDAPQRGSPGFLPAMLDFCRQFVHLFTRRRLQNALIATSTVNLAQQLCGVNVPAFYSGIVLQGNASGEPHEEKKAMALSLGFDTMGRRRWLLSTLPLMAIFMLGASLAYLSNDKAAQTGIIGTFFILFAVVYSPALGPIPFTLASESFPLSHREAGAAWAISVNLFFAGILSMFFPKLYHSLEGQRTFGIFSALNLAAFFLVFFLVEETKQRSLEELDYVFELPKLEFIRFQFFEYLPWWLNRYVLGVTYYPAPTPPMRQPFERRTSEFSLGGGIRRPGRQPLEEEARSTALI
ncbi:hypothetical protein NLG97_g3450 [Lecanicillium saksenae]|uniref:Uncharacterized protein n=1 Tax=Lecanicillium saksenae TaxID=468837 RepID=A0ACC1R1C3_9HYPO|nr:hypothetical protein NLG97_g3450 [Lecanicillium saksenae]